MHFIDTFHKEDAKMVIIVINTYHQWQVGYNFFTCTRDSDYMTPVFPSSVRPENVNYYE